MGPGWCRNEWAMEDDPEVGTEAREVRQEEKVSGGKGREISTRICAGVTEKALKLMKV